MKKIFLAVLVFTLATIVNAQTGLGIQVGVNFSNIAGKDVNGAKMKTGFQAGVNYNIPIATNFVVQPGLNFVNNGFKSNSFLGSDSTMKLNLPYLQLPVLLQFRPEFTDGSKMIIGVGPYVAYGVGKVKASLGNQSETTTWSETENEIGIKRLDAGAKTLIGYEMNNGISFNLNADLGLTKFVENTKSHTVAFGFTVGYRF